MTTLSVLLEVARHRRRGSRALVEKAARRTVGTRLEPISYAGGVYTALHLWPVSRFRLTLRAGRE